MSEFTTTGDGVSPRRRVARVLATVLLVGLVGFALGLRVESSEQPTDPVPPAAQPASAGQPGPANGAPDRSRDGAVAAAAGYATLPVRLFTATPAEARQIATEAASDAFRPELLALVEADLTRLQQEAVDLVGFPAYRQAVLGTRLDNYKEDQGESDGAGSSAQVSVWVLHIASRRPPTRSSTGEDVAANPVAEFATVGVDVVWERGAWRLDNMSQEEGPTPLLSGSPVSLEQFEAALRGFAVWRPR